jgi:hypothetical protein
LRAFHFLTQWSASIKRREEDSPVFQDKKVIILDPDAEQLNHTEGKMASITTHKDNRFLKFALE